MKITGAQIRAARAFLKWTIADLAEASDVGISTVQEVEKIDGEPRVASTLQWRSDARVEALTKIRGALEKAGITFLPETAHGVGLRGRQKG
jgi:transcriptional regulator with XRE-family HTH domain